MVFTADENIDKEIVIELNKYHTVNYVADLSPGIDDQEVLALSNKNKSILITADKDFGELIFQQNKNSYGVILLRLHGLEQDKKARIVAKAIQEHGTEFNNSFTVITKKIIRIRRMN